MATSTNRVLSDLDNAKFQWYHVKAVLVSGVGFFTDAYDLFSVGIMVPMIAFARWPNEPKLGKLPKDLDYTVKAAALIGTLVGQVVFGLLGDRGGRKRVYGWTLWLMIAASVLNAATTWGSQKAFIIQFCIWRFVLGVGIGGDYPLSAVITSEYSSVGFRGMLIAAIFSMQGIGILAAAIVGMIVLSGFKSQIENCKVHEPCKALDHAWRIMVAFGAIPAIATMYLRHTLPETPRYTLQVEGDVNKAENDVQEVMDDDKAPQHDAEEATKTVAPANAHVFTWKEFGVFLSNPKCAMVLFGTASTWFLLDVAYYSQNLLQSNLYGDIHYTHKVGKNSTGHDIYQKVFKNAAAAAIVAMLGTVPGYWFCIAFIERMGRKTIQIMGFIMMTVCLTILSIAYNHLRADAIWAFIMLYAMMFFFANFGPNTTTFIIPGECFPTRFRSTCHGLSAAAGKAGAVVGLYAFGNIAEYHGYRIALGALAVFMFAGLVCTYWVPETKGKSLEELGDEMDAPTADAQLAKSTST